MAAGLMDILKQAGFSGSALQTAYAVAMGESGGNARAYNGNRKTGDNSYGLFQINMIDGMGPERRRQFGLENNDSLYDALTNAKVAYKMSKGGTDWSPWSAYNNGSYKKYLGQSGASVATSGGPAMTSGTLPTAPSTVATGQADIIGSGLGRDFAESVGSFGSGGKDFSKVQQQSGAAPQAATYSGGGSGSSSFRDKVIAAAMSQLGVRYSWGGGSTKGPSAGFGKGSGIVGFDCSSLMQYAFAQAGYSIPRTGRPQLALGQRVPVSQLRPGDFLGWGDGHHIALYLGDGKYIHAPTTGRTVEIKTLSSGSSAWGVRLSLPGD